MSFELRELQTKFVGDIRGHMQAGRRTILGQAPTGFGKTAVASFMMGTAAERNTAGVFMVHRRELVRQTITAFDKVGIRYGVIAAGFHEQPRALVQIASVQTYARRMSRFARPALVLWDECHHLVAESWASIFRGLDRAYHVGLTATPKRLDGSGLGDFFETMVEGPTVAQLIEEGWLSPYRLYAPPGLSVAGVHSRMGDFVKSEIAAAADKPTITGDAIREYKRYCNGGRAVVFCATIDHSLHVAAQFRAAGIAAAHIDGDTPTEERDDVLQSFERGDIRVVCNVELFGEGFDLPALDCVIGLRPTQSTALALQQWGRALRPVYAEGFDLSTKEGRRLAIAAGPKPYAVLLDHAGNCDRHGLPDDERAWSLEGGSRADSSEGGAGGPLVKRCRSCREMQPRAVSACRACGTEFPAGGGTPDVEHVAGDLVAIDAGVVRESRLRAQGAAKSFDELVAFGRSQGYKDPTGWARHVHAARLKKEQERPRGL